MDNDRKQRFLALLEPVYPRLSRYALAMTRDRDDAKDLVSESILAALERFDSLRSEAGFAGFLFRIALRTHRHARYRERMKVPFDERALAQLEDGNASPERAGEMAIVLAALDSLPKRMKETVLLYDVADLSLEAIRAVQGGTLSGVKSRLRRGHETLRILLGTEMEFPKRMGKKMLDREEVYAIS
ncbi:MAG TPA: RNA polymerase sigma factor [Candidatus Kapabacteria bacterium]|jgi:RNA polymerase sigma-70 factor (ECF subfamily)